jgi:nucleoside-diphosphate-sugar epimerase
MSKQHVLVLGSTGFIGSSFTRAMIKDPLVHVHLLVRNRNKVDIDNNRVTIYEGDINSFKWDKLQYPPNIVYHFARQNARRGRALGRKWSAFKGYRANDRLLQFLSSLDNPIQLFYLSGSLMYGNSKGEIDESSSLNPISFAKDYVIAEKPFSKYQSFEDSNLKITLVRVPWVLGMGSWFEAFYLNHIEKNNKVPLYGAGVNSMSFITRNDLAVCLVKLKEFSYKKVINLQYSKRLKQLEFAEILAKITNKEIEHIELNKIHEKAVVEAFESNIILTSKYKLFDEVLQVKDLQTILSSLLKDIK